MGVSWSVDSLDTFHGTSPSFSLLGHQLGCVTFEDLICHGGIPGPGTQLGHHQELGQLLEQNLDEDS